MYTQSDIGVVRYRDWRMGECVGGGTLPQRFSLYRKCHIMKQSNIFNEKGNTLCMWLGMKKGIVKREKRKKSGHAAGVIEFGQAGAGCDRYVDWVCFSGTQMERPVVKKIKTIRRTFQQNLEGWGFELPQASNYTTQYYKVTLSHVTLPHIPSGNMNLSCW